MITSSSAPREPSLDVERPSREPSAVDPDRGVLERVAAGDTESFALLVERHERRLVQLCRHMLRDPGEAEEAVQEVFLKAFRKAPSFRPRGRVFTWLYRIAVNHCLNILRRRSIVRFVSLGRSAREDDEGTGDGQHTEPADGAPDAADRLEQRRRLRALRRALDRLPPSQRTVVVLVRLEGLSYRDAAAAMEISVKALESRLVRAMRTLSTADAEWRRG